ncbi:hypothetical protein [Candidatus Tisiphia endosymbiont of Oplodontha viridula]|uniref:hypothetical protein n=1 Tax=Candidatus Tisiphia endosymbiont of Oplodontha viridula TaxID=3077925 RepID=UPI0035C8DB7A
MSLQVKDAIIRLEQTKLVSSSFRAVVAYGRKFTNELFLILHVGNVLKLTNRLLSKLVCVDGFEVGASLRTAVSNVCEEQSDQHHVQIISRSRV